MTNKNPYAGIACKYILFLILFSLSCKDKTTAMAVNEELHTAILQKTTDSSALVTFKFQHSPQFKAYDSLKNIGQLTKEEQMLHDSLTEEGVALAIKFVKDVMKIKNLQNEK